MSQESSVLFLKGRNVSLRPIEKSDLPAITRWINDPEVRRFIGNNDPQNTENELKWLEGLGKKRATDRVFIMQTAEGQAVGVMGLHGINRDDRRATTGALIGEKNYWGKGLGSEAKLLLLNYAFNTLNLRKICSSVIGFNERSFKYCLKCGYKEEGRLKEHVFRDGRYWEFIQLAVFRHDFEPIWRKYQEKI